MDRAPALVPCASILAVGQSFTPQTIAGGHPWGLNTSGRPQFGSFSVSGARTLLGFTHGQLVNACG